MVIHSSTHNNAVIILHLWNAKYFTIFWLMVYKPPPKTWGRIFPNFGRLVIEKERTTKKGRRLERTVREERI